MALASASRRTVADAGSNGGVGWAAAASSPVPVDEAQLGTLERAALRRCGAADAGLQSTARWIAARKLGGSAMPELDEIAFAQRASGEPHPWARAWAASARGMSDPTALQRLEEWLATESAGPQRRCGAAAGRGEGDLRVLVVVVVDAVADLVVPVPTRVRMGQWVTLEARLRAPARGGRVLVLGPSGVPRSLLTSFDGETLRARFSPDRRGEFAVQVLADLRDGPRPVLETSVFAETQPPASPPDAVAPGEELAQARADDDVLGGMLQAARASAGAHALAGDERLRELATQHAWRMARARRLGHDVGDGDPINRLRAVGLEPRDVGENVAHAPSVALAHRAMWCSPSHRSNMLRSDFDRFGAAAVRDERGDVWAVELFTSGLP
ncbi:MAG TPA: CAP domain-containing protein [Polyangiaceae bacterium]|nr:CAP domain-containing protein [Polyangiaceae bacterium]